MGNIVLKKISIEEFDQAIPVLKSSFSIYKTMDLTTSYMEKLFSIDEDIANGGLYTLDFNGETASFIQVVDRKLCFYPSIIGVAGIANVATHPKYRGRGFASKLLKHVLDDVRDKGYSISGLITGYGDRPYRIYRRAGFRDIATYYNHVCVLDDIDFLRKHCIADQRVSIEVLDKPDKYASVFSRLYMKAICRKCNSVVWRSVSRWKGILNYNPFFTWFLGDPREKIFIARYSGELSGYSILYYVRDSVLSKQMDNSLAFVNEIVFNNKVVGQSLINYITSKIISDGIKTLVFRVPRMYYSVVKYCRVVGVDEVFMIKVINYTDFISELEDYFMDKSVFPISFCIKTDSGFVRVSKKDYGVEVDHVGSCSSSIVLDEGAFLRILFGSTTSYREYFVDRVVVKDTSVREKLRMVNDFLKGRRVHYMSFIDKW